MHPVASIVRFACSARRPESPRATIVSSTTPTSPTNSWSEVTISAANDQVVRHASEFRSTGRSPWWRDWEATPSRCLSELFLSVAPIDLRPEIQIQEGAEIAERRERILEIADGVRVENGSVELI